ncbi:hypothetical protein LQU94_06195 [Peptoniphilus sp. KCTC 25270]|uniref:hypothetical protein n=1 Tax=Peptoniphilus sp. KCTC 25270 TaxID=2897414 RepID=UPI001E3DC1BB|nr:hypothetical protein [Peptoniphilus sp. KCTC 25270]MCD1147701.1 hypothetical protein [Peptoniphilus sp. KCTC 25270]
MKITKINKDEFVQVNGSYGFNQNWMRGMVSDFYVLRGCGVAAIANAIFYLEEEYSVEKKKALAFMKDLFSSLRPRIWGIGSIWALNMGLKKWARRGNPYYEIIPYRGKDYGTEALDYIRSCLKRNQPVLMLNTDFGHRAFRLHWITITELREEGEEATIYFSSWGRRYKLNFWKYFNQPTFHRSMGVLVKRGEFS